ncbi:MAG: CPBP family intramembrane metalloprotease [Alphaproteobacteria bacterium]|nr:CPBP family intramembrane metalloprotease [Alphaproteobacteria bacterium]
MTKIFSSDFGENSRRTWFWAVFILLPVFFIGGQLTVLLPAKVTNLVTRENVETYPTILYFLMASFGASFLLLYLWVRFFERRSLAGVGLSFDKAFKSFFPKGFGFGLLMATVSVVGVWLVGGYTLERAQDFSLVSYGPILLLGVAFIIQSSVEEVLFRGWMLSRLSERFNIWVGVLGNSLLFTLMHVEGIGGEGFDPLVFAIFTLMTMFFSIFASFITIRQNSVWGACAWHAAWNWSFITWFGLPTTGIALDVKPLWVDLMIQTGAPDWLSGGAQGPENSAITGLVLIAGCLLAYRGLKKKTQD